MVEIKQSAWNQDFCDFFVLYFFAYSSIQFFGVNESFCTTCILCAIPKLKWNKLMMVIIIIIIIIVKIIIIVIIIIIIIIIIVIIIIVIMIVIIAILLST